MSELLFMEPVFKEAIWGGSRLKEVYGYDIPSDHTGECWAISAHKSGDGRVASGAYKGQTTRSCSAQRARRVCFRCWSRSSTPRAI